MFNHDLPRKNHDLHISIPILKITIEGHTFDIRKHKSKFQYIIINYFII